MECESRARPRLVDAGPVEPITEIRAHRSNGRDQPEAGACGPMKVHDIEVRAFRGDIGAIEEHHPP